MLGSKRDLDILFTSGGTEVLNYLLKIYENKYNFIYSLKNRQTTLCFTQLWNILKTHYWLMKNHVMQDLTLSLQMSSMMQFFFFKNEDVDYVPVSMETGKISSTDILNSIKPNTCLVSVMLANNETGVIMPVEEISL